MNLACAEPIRGVAVSCNKRAGQGRQATCPSERCAHLPEPFGINRGECVAVGGGGQDGDGSSFEMWREGLHPLRLLAESKD